jgi:RNA polymerase sigma-70 factor (ECF subfamily)
MRLLTGPATAATAAETVEPEAALIADARRGDRSAFGRLHDRYAPMVHALLLARVGVEQAEDLTQECFLLAMRRIRTLRDPGAFGPWLATIARNLAADHYRKRRPTEALVVESREAEPADCPQDDARAALAALKTLPEAYRETLMMRLVEGLSGPEIAARTGLTPGSVRVNLHRGMAILRERLAAKEGTP